MSLLFKKILAWVLKNSVVRVLTGGLKGLGTPVGIFLLALGLLVGIGATYYVMDKYNKAEAYEVLKSDYNKLKKEKEGLFDYYHQSMVVLHGVISEMVSKEIEIVEVEKVVNKEIVKYVDKNPDCNLRRGAVGLLNNSRGHMSATEESAKLSDDAKREPSAFTQRDNIEAHAQCGIEYQRLKNRYDSLVRWLNDNNMISE